jgi:hypothetical protein
MTMKDKDYLQIVDKAALGFEGQLNDLEGAIGALMFGRFIGWRPLFLMHDRKKIKKYENILQVEFREVLPEIGEKASKSIAWGLFKKFNNFWKAVNGHIPDVRSNKVK